jgi:hypothetical protein
MTMDRAPEGGMMLAVGDGVLVTCEEGYYLLGEGVVQCRSDVDLNLLLPSCLLSNPAVT